MKEKTAPHKGSFWDDITQKCDNLALSTHVRIISHDIQYLNIQLAEGQYFFKDIRREGCLLYDSGSSKLARKRKLKPEEQKRIAEDYYHNWFKSARMFFDHFEHDMVRGLNDKSFFKLAAFHLHQSAEASYKAVLLVFAGYSPNEHYLGLLGRMAAEHEALLLKIFPQTTDKEEEQFRLLDYAYIGARYDPDYYITKEDLEYFSERVKILLELTEKICKEKIQSFTEKTKSKG